MTDDLIDFAVREFNAYPKFLAVMRNRPHYVPRHQEWPPKWVNEHGRDGPMLIDKQKFLRYVCILYLLGVRGLQNANLDDMFSRSPLLRENWLCRLTNRRELGRFLRQVGWSICVCLVCVCVCVVNCYH